MTAAIEDHQACPGDRPCGVFCVPDRHHEVVARPDLRHFLIEEIWRMKEEQLEVRVSIARAHIGDETARPSVAEIHRKHEEAMKTSTEGMKRAKTLEKEFTALANRVEAKLVEARDAEYAESQRTGVWRNALKDATPIELLHRSLMVFQSRHFIADATRGKFFGYNVDTQREAAHFYDSLINQRLKPLIARAQELGA